jgi:hypothetical protein
MNSWDGPSIKKDGIKSQLGAGRTHCVFKYAVLSLRGGLTSSKKDGIKSQLGTGRMLESRGRRPLDPEHGEKCEGWDAHMREHGEESNKCVVFFF